MQLQTKIRFMLTLKTISDNPELVIKKLAKKHFDGKEFIEKVLELDQTRKKTQTILDASLAESNTLSVKSRKFPSKP